MAAVLLAPLSAFALANSSDAAATAVGLGTAGSYSVLAGSTVTNTGPTVMNANLGLSPGSSVTGFPPGIVNGTQHVTDTGAAQAELDLVTAYNAAASEGPTSPIVADLGGQELTPGVYNSASSIGLTGALTLNARGNPNAVFVFQADTSTLTTATASSVNLINGAQACNVFWQVGSSATLGTASSFSGTILALQSITVTTGVTIVGRVLARNGAVTLDSDTITSPTCVTAASVTTTTAVVGATGTTTSAPATAVSKAAVAKAAAKRAAAAKAAAVTTTVPSNSVPTAPKSPIGTSQVRVTG
jgi:hypothetical protein